MEILALFWVAGLIAYFSMTTERQRENLLLVTWGLMLVPVVYFVVRVLLL